MLRLILRHMHNALLFACILLLLCSFERLCRYDFAQITAPHPNILEEGLQVDHFVFWGGIPAWEDAAKNPVSVYWNTFLSWANRYMYSGGADIIIKAVIVPPPADEEMLLNTATSSLTQANLMMKRQIRHHKKKQRNTSRSKEEIMEGSQPTASIETDETTYPAQSSSAAPQPKIGFVLHLPTCDREAIVSWQKVWNEQALDQPFLFYILLGATVEESCAPSLQEALQSSSDVLYQVSRNDPMAMALQTCQSRDHILEGLDEFLYYDVSKAVGRLRSSASMRRFQRSMVVPSSFQCAGGQQRPAFCDETVLDCPWFQYAPEDVPPETELPASTA